MGLLKSAHIVKLLQTPAIAERWKAKHGRYPIPSDDMPLMMERFNPIQMASLRKYGKLIRGTAKTINILRNEYGLKIGTTTGFLRQHVDVLKEEAQKQGYVPDVDVAGDEATMPRPYPYMLMQNIIKMGIMNVQAVVKVDDTVTGVQEGLNGGTWAVGLYATSNYMNINSIPHGLSKKEFAERAAVSRDILVKSGAHYVIPDITHLPRVVANINKRLSNGETP